MQDTFCQETDQILLTTKEIFYGSTLAPKKCHIYMFLEIKDAMKESKYSTKKVHYVDTLYRRTYFSDTAVPCESKTATK